MTSIARRLLLCVSLIAGVTAPAAAQEAEAPPRVAVGVRFGPSFTSLSAIEPFDPTIVARSFEPTMNFGAFVTIDAGGPLAIQPEVLFAARGHRAYPFGARPVATDAGVRLPPATDVVLIRYIEFPVLARLSKQTRPATSVYVIGGPSFALRRSAVVRRVNDPGQYVDIDELVARSNLSIVFGGGLQHERWLADARYSMGLSNIAVGPTAPIAKANAFTVLLGVRF